MALMERVDGVMITNAKLTDLVRLRAFRKQMSTLE